MMKFDENTGVKKLADTLKRCGIASSIHDAHRMANDITSTEKKVQNFFDNKKEEISKENLDRHKRLVQMPAEKRRDTTHVRTNFEAMVERAKNPRPLEIQADFDMPKHSPEEKRDEDVLTSEKPLNEVLGEKEDYINKYIAGDLEVNESSQTTKSKPEKIDIKEEVMVKEEVKPQVMPPQAAPQMQKPVQTEKQPEKKQETQIDIHDYFNFSKKDGQKPKVSVNRKPEPNSPQKTIQSSAQTKTVESHPKTGTNDQNIDINEYFNFAKRGLL